MKTNKQVFFLSTAIILLLSSCKKEISTGGNNIANDFPETIPAIQTAVFANVSANCAGFYQALPARYDSTTKNYPLLVFIHGIGELGNGISDLPKMLVTGIPNFLKNKKLPPDFVVGGKHYSFIIISPQFKARPTADNFQSVVDYALAHYRVDTSRIYITGLSMGGGVAWEYGAKYAAKIAAVVPICGGTWPDNTRAKQIADANLPVWAFHNNDDVTVPVSYSKDYVTKINSYNPNPLAKITVWATGGHNAWTKAYGPDYKENNTNMYEWMLQYKRSNSK